MGLLNYFYGWYILIVPGNISIEFIPTYPLIYDFGLVKQGPLLIRNLRVCKEVKEYDVIELQTLSLVDCET